MAKRSKRERGYEFVQVDGRTQLRIAAYHDGTWLDAVLDDDWMLSYRLGYAEDGKVGIRELHVRPRHGSMEQMIERPMPGGGIDSALLRRIRIGAELRYGPAVLREQTLKPTETRRRHRSGVGRPRLPEKFYRELVREYRKIMKQPRPDKLLAVKFGRVPSSIRAMLSRCRERGLL